MQKNLFNSVAVKHIKQVRSTIVSKRVQVIGIVLIFSFTALAWPVLSRANGVSTVFEAESGTTQGSVSVASDSNASGNQYIQFNEVSSGGGVGSTTSPCTTFAGPITISSGGTYDGQCWQSSSASAVVRITTNQPVIIENSTLKGPGRLLESGTSGVNLTVRNSYFIGVTPGGNVDNRRAVYLNNPSNVRLENNYLENNGGFKVDKWTSTSGPNNTIKILRNIAKNMTRDKVSGADWAHQFFQTDGVTISDAEIAWNQVINEFGQSWVEDNINYFNGGGKSTSPVSIHDNFIWGAYPKTLDGGYSGGGIIMVDAYDSTTHGYFNVFNNQIVGSANYGISIVGGSYVKVYNNRLINSNKIPSGQQFTNTGNGSLGLSFWRHASGSGAYEYNSMYNNYVAWWSSNGTCCHRNDWWTPNATGTNTFTGNTQYQPTNANIPYSMEQDEYTRWLQKLTDNSVKIGPQN